MKSTTEVFEDHLVKRLAGKVEEDIRQNYATDVIFMTGTGASKGHDGVRRFAKELSDYIKDAQFEYTHTLVMGTYAFLEWTATAADRKVCDGADSFVIQDGKIVFQSAHYSVSPR